MSAKWKIKQMPYGLSAEHTRFRVFRRKWFWWTHLDSFDTVEAAKRYIDIAMEPPVYLDADGREVSS